jgi:hypothetical protein
MVRFAKRTVRDWLLLWEGYTGVDTGMVRLDRERDVGIRVSFAVWGGTVMGELKYLRCIIVVEHTFVLLARGSPTMVDTEGTADRGMQVDVVQTGSRRALVVSG